MARTARMDSFISACRECGAARERYAGLWLSQDTTYYECTRVWDEFGCEEIEDADTIPDWCPLPEAEEATDADR
jgi:hypothetical protein